MVKKNILSALGIIVNITFLLCQADTYNISTTHAPYIRSFTYASLTDIANLHWPKAVDHVLIKELKDDANALSKFFEHGFIEIVNNLPDDSPDTKVVFNYGTAPLSPGAKPGSINISSLLKKPLQLTTSGFSVTIQCFNEGFVVDEKNNGMGQALIYIKSQTMLPEAADQGQVVKCQGVVIGNLAMLYNFVIQQSLIRALNSNASFNVNPPLTQMHRVLKWGPAQLKFPQWKITLTITNKGVGGAPIATVTGFDFGVDFIDPLQSEALLSKEITVKPNDNWKLVDNKDTTRVFLQISDPVEGRTDLPRVASWVKDVKFQFERSTLIEDIKNCVIDPSK